MPNLKSYRESRDTLLAKIITDFSKDERFVAAWLTGSLSRNEEDSVSDIDISLVVSDKFSTTLCMKLAQISAQTSHERLLLFSQFGSPALIHENNNNAPENGTFTFMLYTESALMVDWILIPESKAIRPHNSKLLFEKISVPTAPPPEPEDLEQSRKSVAETWAFFWMMAAITIKYIIRGDSVFVTAWIENLYKLVKDIERRINKEAWSYTRGSLSQIQTTSEKQVESIRKLCERMQRLRPQVSEFIKSEPANPMSEIEILFSIVNK